MPESTTSAKPRSLGADAVSERKREVLNPIAEELYAELEARDMWSLSAASKYLRELLRSAPDNFDQLLKKTRVSRLIDVIRLFPELFELTQRPGLRADQEHYYVKRLE